MRYGEAMLASWLVIMFSKKGITNNLLGHLKISCWSGPVLGCLEAGRKEIEWLEELQWTGHPGCLKGI